MSGQVDQLFRIRKQDLPKSGAVLTDAFQKDPVWNAVFGANSTPEQKHIVFSTPVRYCMKFGEAYATSKDLEGIIAWTPGWAAEMTLWRLIQSGGFLSGMIIGVPLTLRMESVFRQLTADQKENLRRSPFLYLQILGVGSRFQGRGLGGRLLRALIEKSEQSGTAIYLETETESNVRMYEKFGFRVGKEILLDKIGLPMWEMTREPS
jgi:ribosomal protein S18 acetylase RimI-like enzyme